ncbi:hypothetical protein [Xenorhabdus bovienii]|uniref:hypothetical protein n=1 Tax=Xenorhabdus bovienii TaxID=40576 RepID=UPI00237CE697|nr:hypothetical protein [Xenorhabdus bovienii]MDE1483922.1 hypothetical protein [Xenorhabdus bovienii]MDE9459327.1 hypothetical protein [Xenorhabdus bovienii]MDE9483518.1 hypothetical protein [Xenorhabdus bovienii]MDE9515520.1 hypothetical protein [Xenorhabdus bovienii]
MSGNISNFGIVIRINGKTGMIHMSPSMKRLLSALCLNSLKEDGPLKFMPMEGLELIPDVETFGEQENQK